MLMQCVLALVPASGDPAACMSDHPMNFYLSMFYRTYSFLLFYQISLDMSEREREAEVKHMNSKSLL